MYFEMIEKVLEEKPVLTSAALQAHGLFETGALVRLLFRKAVDNVLFLEEITPELVTGLLESTCELFDCVEDLPIQVQQLITEFSFHIAEHGECYKTTEEYLARFEALGYTFEYGLDAAPYDLRPLAKFSHF